MICRDTQAALSARMDGDVHPLSAAASAHAADCPRCRAFQSGALRLRQAVRFRVAEPVPDLVGAVMARVAADAATRPVRIVRDAPRAPHRPTGAFPRLVAAALVGALVGVALVEGGLTPRRTAPEALATEIPHAVARAAANLRAYSATFRIVERGWRPEVPVRTFDAAIAFRAPERLSIDVRDRTAYPADLAVVRGNLSLRVDANRWSLEAPAACPPQSAPACAPEPALHRSVAGRPPFDADAPMPTDVILPVTALAGSDRVEVAGGGTIFGREAVRVRLPADEAGPLFAFFEQGGSWRPLYPADPVDIWLDRHAWLPLRFEVRSAGGPDRAAWATTNGMTPEAAGTLLLSGLVTSLRLNDPSGPAPPRADPAARDRGFVALSAGRLRAALGSAPLVPTDTAGLAPYRWGRFAGQPGAVVSFARGMSWLRIQETRTHPARALFGNVGPLAERVVLPGGSVAFYEPAGDRAGRRLSIHAEGWDLYLESNLPPDDLLRVAGSIPVLGVDPPASWRVRTGPGGLRIERLSLAEAIRRAGFAVLLPRDLPDGVRPAAAELITRPGARAVTVVYRAPGIQAAGFAIRIHQAPGEPLPPASGTDQVGVRVDGALGRWSPVLHQLEWIEGGAYRSIQAPGLGLDPVLELVASLEPAA